MTMTRVANRTLLIAAAALMSTLPADMTLSEPEITAPQGSPPPHVLQRPCGKRDDVVRMLRQQFGESPIAHGLSDSGAVAEVFTSSNGTWTIVATAPNGLTCMVGAGQSWQPVVARDDTI
jgi:hypothetical protein